MSNLLSTTWERVYFKDPLSRFLFVSAGWIEAYAPGRDPAELRGKTDFDVFTQEHASAAFADEQQIIRTGEPVVERVERETYTGRPDAWVSTTKMALRNERGEIIGTFGITRDISAQIMAENALARQADELSAQNEQLRELDQLKDEFVALVSHELRTPLTSIIGYIELLRDERAAGMDADHFARVIQRNAERLLHLVGDLLFLSQIQTGKLALEVCDTHLADIAAEAVQEMRPDAGQKNIELTLSAAVDPHLPVDPTRMAQLLGNLISNAVKFTPEDGKVEVTLAVEGNEAVLSVADTGIGIPAADQEQIFERFFRTEAATRRMIPGSGLGLTISRAIVNAHQGTITVRSDEDHGSTFTVRLPLASASRPAPGTAVTGDAALPVRPYRPCSLTGAALEVMRLGQRPAAGRQVGPDPGDVGILTRSVMAGSSMVIEPGCSGEPRDHDLAGLRARLGHRVPVRGPEAGAARALGIAAARRPRETRDRDPRPHAGRDPAGPLVLEGPLVRGHHRAGQVRVDAQRGGVRLVLRDADVLADGQAEPPAVHVQHGGLVARGETLRLGRGEPQLAVNHGDPGPVHGQHRDVRPPRLTRHRRSGQRHRPRLAARLGERDQPWVLGRERGGLQLVSGQ